MPQFKLICTFALTMKRLITVILLGVALFVSLGKTGGQRIQVLGPDMAVCGVVASDGPNSVLSEAGDAENDSIFAFDTFYLRACDVPSPLVLSMRTGNFFRTIKFMSAARSLTDIDVPLTGINAGERYYNSNFTKTSYRYFVYTLRRLLI